MTGGRVAGVRGSVCGDDRSFDHYARLVRRFLRVPTALVSLVEPRRQVFVGAVGLTEPYATTRQTPLSHSFCQYVVEDSQPLVITDARCDTRLGNNPAIEELGVIAYAGWPLLDAQGRTIGSLCATDSQPRAWTDEDLDVLQDLALACSSELQQSRRAAEESENLARTIVDSVDVAMAFYDVDHQLILSNDLAYQLAVSAGFRLDTPPFAGDHVRRDDNATAVPTHEQLIPRALRGEHGTPAMHWLGTPGRQRAVIGSSREVRHADGSPWGTLIAGYDVTRLVRSAQVTTDFIATVSHELRTPLTSILGYREVLHDELAPTEGLVAVALDVIQRNAENLQRRIEELLDTADRRGRLELHSTDLSALARRVAVTFGEQAKAADVALDVQADGAHWALLDARRIEQAMENLLSNALKYTGSGGCVTLAVSGDDDAVQVTVEDTGVGMTADEVSQAFDHFWRADATHHAAVQGLGIGLTVVQGIVDAHGGFVDIKSYPGGGTTVIVAIPCDGPGSATGGPGVVSPGATATN